MKKLIIITLTIIFSNASLSLAGQFKSRWGVVIGVNPVNITSNYQEPYTRVICEKFRHRNFYTPIVWRNSMILSMKII